MEKSGLIKKGIGKSFTRNTFANTLKSIKSLTVTHISDSMPFLSQITEDINEVKSEVSSRVKEVKKSTNKSLYKFIKDEKISSNINNLMKNLKEDILTGEWDNDRGNDLEDLGFDDLDEFDSSGGDKDNSTYGPDDLNSSDVFVAEANARAISKSTSRITNAIASSTEASLEANKQISINSLKYNGNLINNGFSKLNNAISSLVTFSATTLNDHINNSKTYYETMMSNTENIISLLTEIKDSTVTRESDTKSEKSHFRKIFDKGDSFNIKEFFGLYTEQLKSDIETLKDPVVNTLKSIINNPMKAIANSSIKSLTKRTTHILEDMDKSFNDIFLNLFNKVAKNDWIETLTGVSFRTKTKVSSTDYYKGDLKWNGYSQKSLLDVIPGYLSRIESFLTKQPEIIFDYEKGKWITKGSINEKIKNNIRDSGRTAIEDLREVILETLDFKKLSIEERKSLSSGLDDLAYKMMDNSLKGKDVFELISKGKILTNSSILNATLNYMLSTNNEDFKISNKIKNRTVAELIRASQNLSDYFSEVEKNNSSVYHINSMYNEIDDIMKLRNIQNELYDISSQGYNSNSQSSKKKKKKNKNNIINEAMKISHDREDKEKKSSLSNNIKQFEYKYSNIKKKDIYNKKGYITNVDLYYYNNNKTRNKVYNLINKYNTENWYRFVKDYKNNDIKYDDFVNIWNSSEDYRYSIVMDLLYITGDIDLYSSLPPKKADKMLDDTLKKFSDINEYKLRTREEIIEKNGITEESHQLYGMSKSDFEKAKLKSRKSIRNERLEDMESYLRDASDLTINTENKKGEYSPFSMMKSVLSLPDKVIYGMFKKVDNYVFKTLFDDGRLFGDEDYKGLIPMMKDEVSAQMKDFGDKLNKEVLDPLSKSIKSEELNSTATKIAKMLGIDGSIKNYKENISKYFNGVRDENGNLIQKGLKHDLFDTASKDIKSIFGLGRETIHDIISLGRTYDGGYAEGGIIGSNNINERPKFMEFNKDYESEKDALTEYVSELLWDSGNIPAFAKGGYVSRQMSNRQRNKQHRLRSNLVVNSDNNYTPKSYNEAKNVDVIDGNINDGVVITAQAGESILTKEQTKYLVSSLSDKISKGEASDKDIELAESLGIRTKINTIKDRTIKFIKSQVDKLSNKNNNEDRIDHISNFKNIISKSIESITGKQIKNAESKGFLNSEMVEILKSEGKNNISRLITGGSLGLGVSLFTGLINPFLGLSLGAGIGLVSKSSKIQNSLFGDPNDKDSLINKDIGKYIKNKLPKTTMGGILGSLGSSIFMGSPIPGLIIGSSLAHVSQNEELKAKLFGTGDPEKIIKKKEFAKKILPSMGIGAAALTLTGPFGLLGNIILGSTLGAGVGILGTSDKFQKAIFGEKGSDGKYYGGLLPSFREVVLEPLSDSLTNMFRDTKKWLKDAIYDNIKKGLSPLKKLFVGGAKKALRGIKSVGKKAKRFTANSSVGKGFKRIGRKISTTGFKLAEGNLKRSVLGIGPKLFGATGDFINKSMIKSNGGIGSGEYTAQERYDLANRYGIVDGMGDITEVLMEANQDGDIQKKLDLREGLRYVNNIVDEDNRFIEKGKLKKSASKKLNSFAIRIDKSGGWEEEKKYLKLLKKGEFDKALELLNNTDLDEGIKSDLIEDLSPKAEKMRLLNIKDTSYKSTYDYLKSKNFSDEMISNIISEDSNGNTILNKSFNIEDRLSYINKDINKGSFKLSRYNNTKKENDNSFNSSEELLSDDTHILKTPEELVSIDNTVKKYLPLIAVGTGSITDSSIIESDLKSTKSNSTSSMNKIVNEVKKISRINESNINNDLYKIKSQENEEKVREVDGKKQIKSNNGDWVYDKSDKSTREKLKEESEEKEIKNLFYKKFISLDLSKLSLFEKNTDSEKNSNESFFKKILKFATPLLLGLGSSLLSNLSGDGTGNMISDMFNNIKLSVTEKLYNILGIDKDISPSGRTRSEEEDENAKKERTLAQNMLNNTIGKATGRDGYMGNADFVDGARQTIGSRMSRGIANTIDKVVFKSKSKGQTEVLKSIAKSPLVAGKTLFDMAKSKHNSNLQAPKINLPNTENTEEATRRSSSTIEKIKNSKLGQKISKSTEKITKLLDNTKNKITEFTSKVGNEAISKFNDILDKFYNVMNNIPDFGKVFSDSKFINKLTEFCSDKSVINKIPFDKIVKCIGDITTKIVKKVASSADILIKKGAEAVNKFLLKTVGKGLKSEAKMIPYLGIALAVIDVIYGMVNYKSILGISTNSKLSTLQSLLYRIMGGISYFLLNLPYIWIASLLISEEFLVGLVLDLADVILPETKLSKLREEAKSEIDVVNQKLKEQGKDTISTVTQLNEYNKRQEKKSSKWKPSNWFKDDEMKDTKNKISKVSSGISIQVPKVDLSNLNDNNYSSHKGTYNIDYSNFGIGGEDVNKNQVDFVGKYVKKFESGDKGSRTISSGKGDHGGVSYGSYQLASFSQNGGKIGGSAKAFWDTYYKKNHPNLELINNDSFKKAWLSEVDKDPNGFFGNEHQYIMNKYYKPVIDGVPNIQDFIKSRAMQESIISTSVQYGSGTAKSIFKNAISNKNPDSVSQSELIDSIQTYKSNNVNRHFKSSSQQIKNSLKNNRIPQEKSLLQNISNMPPMDTSKVIGDISNMSSDNNHNGNADPSTLDNEGNVSLSPGTSFMDFISDIGTIVKAMFSGIKPSSKSNESYLNSDGGSPIAINGITSADDHFGYKVTSKFGEQRGSQFHNGIDYGMPVGTPVKTPVSGKVEINKSNPKGYGEYVGIRDTNNMLHIFGHLSDRNMFKKGDKVSAGDVIGLSGNTGASTGPHLHYEVTNTLGTGRKAQDPNQYLSAISKNNTQYAESLDNDNLSTNGKGGPSVNANKIDKKTILQNNNIEELLNKIITLLTIGNSNTSLLQNVITLLNSVSSGDVIINNTNGKEVVDNLRDNVNDMKNSYNMISTDVYKQLERLVTQ